MRADVNCSNCGMAYVLDASLAGNTMPCPSCGAANGLVFPTPPQQLPPAPKPRQAGESPRPVAPPAQTAPAAPAVTQAEPSEAAPTGVGQPGTSRGEADEVVCPRCKLHFVPRRAETQEQRLLRQTVLVVEDMDYFREIAAEALATRFEVKTAANLADARRILSGGGVELLVLDLTLEDGEHGAQILRDMPVKPCPILIYADQDESEMYGASWEELQKLGADDIVMKGMNAGESLLRKACSLLGQAWDEDG